MANIVTRVPHLSDRFADLILLLASLAWLGALQVVFPSYFLWDDNATFFLPQYVFNWRTLVAHHQLPLINFHQYLGYLYLGSGQSGVLYPAIYLAAGIAQGLFGDLRHTMDVLAALHLGAGSLAMAGLLRHLGAQRWIAAASGLLWVTFPFLAQVGRNWIVVTYSALLLPLNLLALERLLVRPSAGRVATLAAIKAIYFYQGYVQYPVLAALLDLFYIAARCLIDPALRRQLRRFVAGYGMALLGSGLLAAPVLLPMLEAKGLSAYRTGALTFEEFISNAMPVGAFLEAQILRPTGPVIHQAGASIFYVGAPCLLALMVIFFPALRRRAGSGPFVAAALAALVALVFSTRAYGIAYWLPLLSSFRWPFKFFLLFLFFVTVAVAGTCELLRRHQPRLGSWLAALLLTAAIGTNLAILFDPAHDRPFGPNRLEGTVETLIAETEERLGDREAGRVVSLWLTPKEPQIARYLVFNFASLAGAYHLGGYDPLIARSHLELAMGLEFSNIFRWDLDARALEHLSTWSVRYLLVPGRDDLRARIETLPWLRRISSAGGIDVWENPGAWPFAAFTDAPYDALDLTFLANEVRVATAGRGGLARITLAPLPWYRAYADGRRVALAEDKGRQMVIDVPPGTRDLRIRYEDSGFRLGLALASLTVLGFVGWNRRKGRQRSPKSAEPR